jgi:hypothetical protein
MQFIYLVFGPSRGATVRPNIHYSLARLRQEKTDTGEKKYQEEGAMQEAHCHACQMLLIKKECARVL